MTRRDEAWLAEYVARTTRAGRAVSVEVDGPQTVSAWKAREAAAPRILEREVLPTVFAALGSHPRVAWVARMNTGGMERGGRYIPFGFTGCADILGMMKDGRFLACEVKRPGGVPTAEQDAFLSTVKRWGGVAFVATSIADVVMELDP